jgi:hypothetical protein
MPSALCPINISCRLLITHCFPLHSLHVTSDEGNLTIDLELGDLDRILAVYPTIINHKVPAHWDVVMSLYGEWGVGFVIALPGFEIEPRWRRKRHPQLHRPRVSHLFPKLPAEACRLRIKHPDPG